jgi:hypothetical protein
MAACIDWRLGFKQSSFHHIPRVPQHPAPVRLGTATAFLACSGPLHLSDPGQPSDPETSLRVPPGCAGDTTRRLAAQRFCRDPRSVSCSGATRLDLVAAPSTCHLLSRTTPGAQAAARTDGETRTPPPTHTQRDRRRGCDRSTRQGRATTTRAGAAGVTCAAPGYRSARLVATVAAADAMRSPLASQ